MVLVLVIAGLSHNFSIVLVIVHQYSKVFTKILSLVVPKQHYFMLCYKSLHFLFFLSVS